MVGGIRPFKLPIPRLETVLGSFMSGEHILVNRFAVLPYADDKL